MYVSGKSQIWSVATLDPWPEMADVGVTQGIYKYCTIACSIPCFVFLTNLNVISNNPCAVLLCWPGRPVWVAEQDLPT